MRKGNTSHGKWAAGASGRGLKAGELLPPAPSRNPGWPIPGSGALLPVSDEQGDSRAERVAEEAGGAPELEVADQLLAKIDEIAEIFWATMKA